jgi:hypothetical protein
MSGRSSRVVKLSLAGLLVVALAGALAVAGWSRLAVSNGTSFSYSVGLWGDLPYSDVQAQVGVPNLIADMNSQDLAFSVHDGDLKAGNGTPGSATPTTCSDALYVQSLAYLNALHAPAMFTPGDNDWTDCDRPANGGFNSLERLDHERQLMFATPFSLGQTKLKQEVQSTPSCLGVGGPTACVENRRWTFGNVVYATVNVQGSCNNLCDTAPDPAEYAARNIADIGWLRQTFAQARASGAAAVMIVGQADPGFDLSDGTRAPLRDPRTLVETDANPDGFHDFLVALRDETVAFAKPVVFVHGDSHYFRIDKPLLDAQGRRLENFTRVETFGDNQANGDNDVHWVKALVDPTSRDVFAFQTQIVPANRVAVPSTPANLVIDSDIELDPSAYFSSDGPGTFTWATDQSHSPTHALKLVSSQPSGSTARWLTRTDTIPVTAGASYDAAAWLKTEGVDHGDAHVTVTYWDAAGAYIAGSAADSAQQLTGSQDWTRIGVTSTAPAGAAFARVEFRLTGPGTLWIDDISVAAH